MIGQMGQMKQIGQLTQSGQYSYSSGGSRGQGLLEGQHTSLMGPTVFTEGPREERKIRGEGEQQITEEMMRNMQFVTGHALNPPIITQGSREERNIRIEGDLMRQMEEQRALEMQGKLKMEEEKRKY
jgi:hypothetical protein